MNFLKSKYHLKMQNASQDVLGSNLDKPVEQKVDESHQDSGSRTTQSDSSIPSSDNESQETADTKKSFVDAGSTSGDVESPKQTDKHLECENTTANANESKEARDSKQAIIDAGSNEVLESEETATKVIKTINYSDYSSSQRTMELKEWETFLKKLPDEIKYIYHYTTQIAADSIVRQGVIHARQPTIGWTGSGVFMTKLDPSSGKEGILNNNYNTSNGWCDYRAQAAIAIRLDQISPEEVHGWFETENPQAAKDRWRNNESINLEKLEYYVIHTGW